MTSTALRWITAVFKASLIAYLQPICCFNVIHILSARSDPAFWRICKEKTKHTYVSRGLKWLFSSLCISIIDDNFGTTQLSKAAKLKACSSLTPYQAFVLSLILYYSNSKQVTCKISQLLTYNSKTVWRVRITPWT